MSSNTDAAAVERSTDAAAIKVQNLSKHYETPGGVEEVLEDINVEIEPQSFVTLIGKSGSGKSTMLDIISDVLEPTSGQVVFERAGGGEVRVGHVFQDPRLLPWETAVGNIRYVHTTNPDYDRSLAERYLDMVSLSDHYDKYSSQLSGGQQQRVGIARAFSIDPHVLLMDEPFSALDEITAEELRSELIDLWQQLQKTVFFVTHDIDEAIELSDRILILGNKEIYGDFDVDLERPRSIESDEFLKMRHKVLDAFHGLKDEEQ